MIISVCDLCDKDCQHEEDSYVIKMTHSGDSGGEESQLDLCSSCWDYIKAMGTRNYESRHPDGNVLPNCDYIMAACVFGIRRHIFDAEYDLVPENEKKNVT